MFGIAILGERQGCHGAGTGYLLGKLCGTMDAVSGISSLKSVIPNIISIAMIKITREPAMANEETSSPIILSSSSPAK